MIGRIVGVIVGAAIAVTGYGMLKPQLFSKYFDFTKLSLGPFSQYHTLVCWLIVAVGVVVALAALQRPSGNGKKKKAPVVFAPSDPEPAHGEAAHHAPEHHEPPHAADAHHDDHGHDDHGHGDHPGHHGDHGHHEPAAQAHEPAH